MSLQECAGKTTRDKNQHAEVLCFLFLCVVDDGEQPQHEKLCVGGSGVGGYATRQICFKKKKKCISDSVAITFKTNTQMGCPKPVIKHLPGFTC